MNGQFRARCFGLTWRSDFPLDLFDPDPDPVDQGDIAVEQVQTLAPRSTIAASRNASFDQRGFRFRWLDAAEFDMVDGDRIMVRPGAQWPGALPHSFYGTVTALTCAWRGLIALHASSVIIGGRAWLIGGQPGAGKSTLAAELLGAGAKLLADDLTMLRPAIGDIPAQAVRGRRSLRLHSATAAAVAGDAPLPIAGDLRGKLLSTPHARADDGPWPIGGLVIVGGTEARALTGPEVAATLGAMTFRPGLSGFLPNAPQRRAALLQLAQALPGWRMPRARTFDGAARAERVAIAVDAIAQMTPG